MKRHVYNADFALII